MNGYLKSFLKKFFPLVFLRSIQLEINKIRIKTIDKWRFPEKHFVQEDFIIKRDDYPFRITKVNITHLDDRLRSQVVDNYSWTQDEYLLVYEKKCIIEPKFGWALTTNNELIYPSLGFSRASYLSRPTLNLNSIDYLKLTKYKELISLRDTGEENYYHFYNDILTKLFFLEEKVGLNKKIPLLISKALFDKPYFKYFLTHPYLKDREWILQDKQPVISSKTFFCKPLTHTYRYYKRILELVRPEDLPTSCVEKRVFITRSPKRLRFIENNSEVISICLDFGFEVVDFDELTVSQQICIMSQARYVVGIHGAGLANILFRGSRPMGLLEIYPPGTYFPFHYILMANQLNYNYDGLIGLPSSQQFSGGFRIDTNEFRQKLTLLLRA